MAGPARPITLWLVVAAVLVTAVAGAGVGLATTRPPETLSWSSGAADSDPPPPTTPSAPALVRLADGAASSSYGAAVLALLERHFTAINQRDFTTWTTTVTPARARDQSADRWRAAYRSTVDSEVIVTAIVTAGNGVAVSLAFVSSQDPADAPQDLHVSRICWTSVWPVDNVSQNLRIGVPSPGATAKRRC